MTTQDSAYGQALMERTRSSAHTDCLFCDQRNPGGFRLGFRAQDDGSVRADFDCERSLQGYSDVLHGGVVSALLDAAMTNCLFSHGIVAVTAELTVRFVRPVRTGQPAELTAVVSGVRGPLYDLCAELRQEGIIRAHARARFMRSKCPVPGLDTGGGQPAPSRDDS